MSLCHLQIVSHLDKKYVSLHIWMLRVVSIFTTGNRTLFHLMAHLVLENE